MEWTDRLINAFETIDEVGLMIDDALEKIHDEIIKAYKQTKRVNEEYKNEYILQGLKMQCRGGVEIIWIDSYYLEFNHNEVYRRILKTKGSLEGITADEICEILIKMIKEQTTWESILGQIENMSEVAEELIEEHNEELLKEHNEKLRILNRGLFKQIKIFGGSRDHWNKDYEKVEEDANNWIKSNKEIKVDDIRLNTDDEENYYITVIYTE